MFCPHCGTKNDEKSRFCAGCTSPVIDDVTNNSGAYVSSYKKGVRPPNSNSPEYATKVLSTSGWLAMLILTFIPVINVVMMFVWAFGGVSNHNQRNFARAVLIFLSVTTLLSIGLLYYIFSYSAKTINSELSLEDSVTNIWSQNSTKEESTLVSPESTSIVDPNVTVTKAEFDQVQEGMSKEQVFAIVGGQGEVLAEVGAQGSEFYMIMFTYNGQGGFGSNANFSFQNDLLVSKAQIGLN